jgi:outer membrane protein assembly factor BamB
MQNRHGLRRPSLALRAGAFCLLSLLAGLAGCGTGPASPGSLPAYRPGPAPAVSGHGLTALWQGAPWDLQTVADGLVLGYQYASGRDFVRAVSALTGAPVWAARVPRTQPAVLGIVAGPRVVIAQVGHAIGHAPAMVAPVVREEMVLDARTGRLLWTIPATGGQAPALAIAGSVVVSGHRGSLTARKAATGSVLWQRSAPSGCPATGAVSFGPLLDGSIAADGSLLAASFMCPGGRVLVQRLAAATGRLVWQWESPPAGGGTQVALSVIGAARQGRLVLLAGSIFPSAAAYPLVRTVSRPYAWPVRLGPPANSELILALDAATGHPRWSDFVGQQETYSLADGAVCTGNSIGLECRDDVTGVPTRPLLVTGQGFTLPPYTGDGTAGISGGDAAVTLPPFRPGHVRLVVLPIRHTGQLAAASLDIGTTAPGANEHTFVVAAGQLPSGGTVVLLRRIDQPGYPLVALKVAS